MKRKEKKQGSQKWVSKNTEPCIKNMTSKSKLGSGSGAASIIDYTRLGHNPVSTSP